MKYKPYSEHFWTQLKKNLDEVVNSQENPIAAFDADGTLWDTDLGEDFFHYQIDNKLVPLPPEPWTHYLELKKKNNDPREAYAWLAQINHGLKLETVRNWSQASFESYKPQPIFDEQRRVIDLLMSKNVSIYIVTASVKWAVEPGALALGLQREQVIGVETQIKNEIITTEVVHPVTYRQGKVDALLQKTQGRKPFFCSGNTMGDFELMLSATHCALAVSAASRDDRLFKTEAELQAFAASKANWHAHRFI